MAQKKVIYSKTYRKNTVSLDKEKVIELINRSDVKLYGVKSGRHDDDTEFLIVVCFERW